MLNKRALAPELTTVDVPAKKKLNTNFKKHNKDNKVVLKSGTP